MVVFFSKSEMMVALSRDEHVMTEWRLLARLLGVSEADITDISNRHEKSLSECVFQSLMQWQSTQGHDATKPILIRKLRELSLNRAAGKYTHTHTSTHSNIYINTCARQSLD